MLLAGEPVSAPFKINGDAPLNLAQFSPGATVSGLWRRETTSFNHARKFRESNRPVKDELQFAQMIAGSFCVDEQEAITPVSPTESKDRLDETPRARASRVTLTVLFVFWNRRSAGGGKSWGKILRP